MVTVGQGLAVLTKVLICRVASQAQGRNQNFQAELWKEPCWILAGAQNNFA